MPPPTTAQVATVRHKTSVPAKFQMASNEATTAITMQALVIQKANLVTTRGLRKPRFIVKSRISSCSGRQNHQVGAHRSHVGDGCDAQRQMPRVVSYPDAQLETIGLRVVRT